MDLAGGTMKGANLFGVTRAPLVIGVLLAVLALAALAFAGEGKKIATVTIPPAPELYATEPPPLTVSQCGQCHPGVFRNLKDDGAKHRFDCQKCHTTIHAYNPKKGGWEALMPKCSSCHAEPHDKTITDCANCHTNPHTPKKVAMETRLVNACPVCHASPKEQLVKFPSKHSMLTCQKCHTSHGYKPSCFTCHKPHNVGQELATCTGCHPVHKPLLITYEKDVPAATCGSCHGKVYAKWQKTLSRHSKVNCATCHHSKHRYVPQCTECHAAPHKKEILSRFPSCLSCHLDVHDLPTGKGKGKQ
jgi:hypothetical protein